MLKRINLSGNPNLGVYISATNKQAIVPPTLPKPMEEAIKEALEVDVIRSTISGSNLAGALSVGNSNGFIVSALAYDREVKSLQDKGIVIDRVPDKYTAIGNILLANDNGAVCSPLISDKTMEIIEDKLGVEVCRTTIADFNIVGSVATVTNQGVLSHPTTSSEELELLEDIFKVPAYIGTVNRGAGLIGACSVTNTNGAMVGETTTGPEMARLEEAMGFLKAFQ